VLARSKPPTPASPPGEEVRALALDSMRQILRNRSVYILCIALFLGSGIVNSVFTLIDGLSKNIGLTTDQGVLLVTLLLVGGIAGSVVVPGISDGLRRRKPIILGALFLAVPSTLGLVLGRGFALEVVCFFALGFFVTGVTPVAYQYGAEITHPAPEGTSNGVFAVVVQASGFLILLMDGLHGVFNESYVPTFAGLAILLLACGFVAFGLKESPEMGRR
ncbi:MAG TPA: MFS transporter, partial [bacterium]|nr:MFS transporter [bacterium]